MFIPLLFFVTSLSCAEANSIIKNVINVPSKVLSRKEKIEIINEIKWSTPRKCKFKGVKNV